MLSFKLIGTLVFLLFLTLPAFSANLEEIVSRLDALERENASLRHEINALKKQPVDKPHAPSASQSGTPVHAPARDETSSRRTYSPLSSSLPSSTGSDMSFDGFQTRPKGLLDFHLPQVQPPAGPQNTKSTASGFTFNSEILSLTSNIGEAYSSFASRASKYLDPKNAYRLGFGYEFASGRTLQFSWMHLGQIQNEVIDHDYNDGLESVDDLTYDRADLLFSETLKNTDLKLSLLYGLEYSRINLKRLIPWNNPVDFSTSKMTGIGPQIGLDIDYVLFHHNGRMPGALSIKALTTGSLLFARAQSNSPNDTRFGYGRTIYTNDRTMVLIPAVHMRLGLNYEATIARKMLASVELGYDFNSYFNGIGYTDAQSARDVYFTGDPGLERTQNFTTSGPYISVGIKF